MSTAPTLVPSKQGKGKKEKRRSQTQQNERLKIVVRRLPPNLPEDLFWQSVLPWVTEETTTWKVFYPGKLRKRLNKENIHARAYIAFKNEEQLALFGHQYDGHVFRDKNGVDSQAVVEFAPHSKIPSDKKKADGRSGTIEKDEDYISFMESLKAAEIFEPVSIEVLIASSQPPPPPKTTPLLEALKAEKAAAKDKEAILRNRKQGDAATRKEDKKKATSSVPMPKLAADAKPPPMASKKSRKEQIQVSDVQHSGAVNKSTPRNVPPPAPIPKPIAQHSSTRPPKLPKLREAPPNKAPSTSGSVSASNMTSGASASTSANNQSVTPSQAEPQRRARPVIASRQFEAALSIAGLATSASERRKREKEKVKDATLSSTADDNTATSPRVSKMELQVTTSDNRNAQASKVSANSLSLDTEKAKSSAQSPLPSPKKDRSKSGGRLDRVGTQSSAVANPTAIKIPSILQRSDTAAGSTAVVVPRQPFSNVDSTVIESPTKSDTNPPPGGTGSPPRGRIRRGRGVGGRGTWRGRDRVGQATTAPRDSG